MKKDYIKPEIHLEDFELEPLMELTTSKGGVVDGEGEPDDFSSKDRNNTGDSSWGDLW